MGRYFNPTHVLATVGRPLNGAFTFAGLKAQLQAGEQIVAQLNQDLLAHPSAAFLVCPLISDEAEYLEFDAWGTEIEFYAVKDSDVATYVK